MAKFAPPQTFIEICKPFWACWDITDGILREFACIAQPLQEYLSGKGASKKNKCVMLMEDALGAFNMLKKACLGDPMLSFADVIKLFLLETDTSKQGLGAML